MEYKDKEICPENLLQKRCSKCLYTKLASEFYFDKNQKFNLTSQCKECHKKIKKIKIKVECECGKTIFKSDLKSHVTRPIHLKYLNFKNTFNQNVHTLIDAN